MDATYRNDLDMVARTSSQSTPATVRPASASDAPALADLLALLGYPAAAEDIVGRLARLNEHRSAIILVAQAGDRVAGLVTGHVFPSIHSTPTIAWLTTLVVGDGHQHAGIGRLLVAAVETWARSHGAVRISVTSGKHRDDAHAFYEHIGYERTGVRLTKILV
jgi:GNAT superfamily N-acetyltransferase